MVRSADRCGPVRGGPVRARTVRSWPLLVLAAPAAAEVWSGWVGIAQRTGFGMVSPLPGIWPSLHLDTAITLPVGVEAYAAYALRAWLSGGPAVSERTRRFARRSAIFSFALRHGRAGGLPPAGPGRDDAGAVGGHHHRVLPAGPGPGHGDHAGAHAARRRRRRAPASGPEDPVTSWSPAGPAGTRTDRARTRTAARQDGPGPAARPGPGPPPRSRGPPPVAGGQVEQARLVASRLAAAGKPVSRRALRSNGIRGSNAALSALARTVSAEVAGPPVRAGASAM